LSIADLDCQVREMILRGELAARPGSRLVARHPLRLEALPSVCNHRVRGGVGVRASGEFGGEDVGAMRRHRFPDALSVRNHGIGLKRA
jgi:hypothetical protein